jgi:hypothetical protein
MNDTLIPYAVPDSIESALARVMSYWSGLKRGGNDMPFWDDVSLSALPDLSDDLMLLDAFADPLRFRLSFVGKRLTEKYPEAVSGKFADDFEPREPLAYFLSQCCAAVESRAPTYYRHAPSARWPGAVAYSRLLLPLWGDGRVSMLVGATAWR